jgi:hypothetical protein
MGDFSRDSFRITNALNALLGWTAHPPTDPRHYVAVRLQQGVPILDADVNELDDVRRAEHEAIIRFFVGDGVPAGSDGFRVSATDADDDFALEPGLILIGGVFSWNPGPTTYLGQPNFSGQRRAPLPDLPELPALEPPPMGETRHDMVVLDVWEREVEHTEDDRLLDARVGVETCIRRQREWVVRVVTDVASDASAVPAAVRESLSGHYLYPLARIQRSDAQPRIEPDDITDLRRTDLTLARGEGMLRVYGPTGLLEYGLDDFARICDAGLRLYDGLLHSDLFLGNVLTGITGAESAIVLAVFQDVRSEWSAGREAARRGLLGSRGTTQVLRDLLEAQARFHDRLRPLAEAHSTTLGQFLDEYVALLGDEPGGPPGLREPVEEGRLRDAIDAQIAINDYLASRTSALPFGTIRIDYHQSPPDDEQVTAPGIYRFVYAVTSGLSMPDTLDLTASVAGAPEWTASLEATTIALEPGATGHVDFDLTIPAAAVSTEGTLVLRARSQANPGGIDETNDDVAVTLNALPPQPGPVAIHFGESMPVAVGRGNPPGLPGNRRQIIITITNNEGVPRDYDVTASLADPGVVTAIPDTAPLSLDGGQSEIMGIMLEATEASTNGTFVDLTITVTRQDDPAVSEQRIIQLEVQKG